MVPFLQVFFAIWWAWMNFTWFASSYDTDDVVYRLLTMLQMAGVLVLAAGVPAAADDSDYRAVTLGYLIMRIGLVAQWLRVGIEDRASRCTALRYAAGITIVQVGWILRLFLLDAGALPQSTQVPLFAILAVLELAVPRWSERAGATNWHPHHIAERYGLFTIILLGESVLAATTGVQGALHTAEISGSFITIAVSSLVLLFALWWLYFLEPAGLEVAVEQTGHNLKASPLAVGYAVAIPVGVFLTLLWAVHAPIIAEPVIPPTMVLGSVTLILLLPLAVGWIGASAVVAAIAAACVLLIAATSTTRTG
jgi:low temperature requirement protein LtrA